MPTAAGARKCGRAIASPSRKCRPRASIRKLASATRNRLPLPGGLRAPLDLAGRQPVAAHVAAVADLGASVRTGENRPVAPVDAASLPHVEILVGADETGIRHALADVAAVVDRALEPDREVHRVELVEAVLIGAADLDHRRVGLRLLRS